jgi:ATP-dependent Clp protease ATP-binding subunit ClpA
MTDHRLSIFTRYAKQLLPCDNKTTATLSLKEHTQIPLLIDTLCRKQRHHLLLVKSSSEQFNKATIEALVQHLSIDEIPLKLQQAQCLYFDVTAFMLGTESIDDIENDFRLLLGDMRLNHKPMIFVINQLEPLLNTKQTTSLTALEKLLKSVLTHPQWRLIILSDRTIYQTAIEQHIFLKELFTTIKINEPTETEAFTILKNFRTELEQFHDVVISEETLSSAISLASTYLAGTSSLDKAIELLDSAAARANTLPSPHLTDQKPIVTSTHLAQVVASWTQIPLTHLQNNKFQAGKLTEALQRHIFGQDHAIQQIASTLQNACIKLHKKSGPLCSFLLAGSSGVGKASLVYALADHLFGHQDALLRVHLNPDFQTFSDINVTTGFQNERCIKLLNAIKQTPYAIVFFENVEQLSEKMRVLLKNILTHGYLIDENEMKYDLSHAIVIVSTTAGANSITHFMQATPEKKKQIDLMQLVLNEHLHDGAYPADHGISSQELYEKILPELQKYFSQELLQTMHLITFLPLDYVSLEKIMHNKIKSLAKRLDMHFGIELQFAPEIIKFLAHEALWHSRTKSLNHLLEQQLYACVSHEILAHVEARNKPKRLLLQLNDNGQLLRCEFITSTESSLFNL